MRPSNIKAARFLARRGFAHPYRLVRAARAAGVRLSTACALLNMESGTGKMVYGHDPVRCGPKGGYVTKANYRAYKRNRARCGMQGVGGTQLTWYAFQDRADQLGGCWHPYWNYRVGFEIIRSYVRGGASIRQAYQRYNGSGPAAVRYAQRALTLRARWRKELRVAGIKD